MVIDAVARMELTAVYGAYPVTRFRVAGLVCTLGTSKAERLLDRIKLKMRQRCDQARGRQSCRQRARGRLSDVLDSTGLRFEVWPARRSLTPRRRRADTERDGESWVTAARHRTKSL